MCVCVCFFRQESSIVAGITCSRSAVKKVLVLFVYVYCDLFTCTVLKHCQLVLHTHTRVPITCIPVHHLSHGVVLDVDVFVVFRMIFQSQLT